VQCYFPQADGSGLKLTVAKYLTPGGYDITRQGGLQPDLACDDFPHGVFNGGGLQGRPRPDGCVLQALEHIMSRREGQEGQEGQGAAGQRRPVHLSPEELQVLYASRS
jgi:C-terminal processing protease CtpA/Prc